MKGQQQKQKKENKETDNKKNPKTQINLNLKPKNYSQLNKPIVPESIKIKIPPRNKHEA